MKGVSNLYDILADFLGLFPQEIGFIVPIIFMLICSLTIYGLLVAPWVEKK